MNANRYPTTGAISATQKILVSPLRKISLAAGILYLLTFVSIPTLFLYAPIHDPNYILKPGSDIGVIIGVILEIIVALANIGTAVVMYPILKKQNEVLALAFVAARILEGATMSVGVVFILSVVTLRQTGAGAGALVTIHTLVTMYDHIFLIGQSFIPVVNALLLGSLLYQSGLVPRILPVIGFAGAGLLLMADIAVLFGTIGQRESSTALAAIPIALWELSLGIYLIAKGFKPSPITAGSGH